MPSHVEIHGGNFLNVGGDFNVQNIQPPRDVDEVLAGLELPVGQNPSRQVGAERAIRGESARMLPYDTSHRRQITSRSNNTHEQASSTSGASASQSSFYDHAHEQVPRLRFHQPSMSNGRSGDGVRRPHPSTSNSRAVDSGPDLERMASDNGLGGSSSVVLLPAHSQPDQGPSHPHFRLPPISHLLPGSYPLDRARYSSGSLTPVENERFPSEYNSANFEPSPSNGPEPSVELNVRSHLVLNNNNAFPWNCSPNAPKTRNHDRTFIDGNNNTAFPWNCPPNAPAMTINDGTFINGNVNNVQRHGEMGLHLLHRAIAGDARHDSAERFPQPRCHPNTRQKLLDVLSRWASGIEPPRNWTFEEDEEKNDPASLSDEDNEPSGSILWLYGPAGSGKSAVAQSFCQQLKKDGSLGGSFFFKRGHPSRGNARRLFPTIAYQLALLRPELKQIISQIIENDPAIVDGSFSDQLQDLIIEPCQNSGLSQPVSIIIDGLDECDREDIQQEVLRSIGNAVCQEQVPILFFIASRPESHIRETFAEPCLDGLHRSLNIEQSFHDVRKYLLDEFDRIHREHRTMDTVPFPWPPSGIVEDLVSKSSGYFIYVSTVVKFIDDKRFRPVDRLDIILGIKSSICGSPFDPLDQLYNQILCGVPIDFRPQVLGILAVLASKFDLGISGIEQLLELETGDIRLILRGLHSVIEVPEEDLPEKGSRLYVHHASFLDFLKDPSRSGQFCVRSPQCCTNLTRYLLKAFSYDDPLLNRPRHVAWNLGREEDPFEYITSVEPSPDLLPLVHSFNPDYLFLNPDYPLTHTESLFGCGPKKGFSTAGNFWKWLEKFDAIPDDLRQLWAEYTFIGLCDETWTQTELTKEPSDSFHDILSQTSPELIAILYAYKVLLSNGMPHRNCFLFRIRSCLGLSWDTLRAAICPLFKVLGAGSERLGDLLLAFNSDQTILRRVDSQSIVLELARGGLRFMRAGINGLRLVKAGVNTAENSWLSYVAGGWGFCLRSCPPSPDLLEDLNAFEIEMRDLMNPWIPHAEEIDQVVEWLETFPQPPIALIARFQHHKKASIEQDDNFMRAIFKIVF